MTAEADQAAASSDEVLVSVIVPCFDVEEFLDDCVTSILRQTHPAVEIVLVDDGSTDRTGEIVDLWARGEQRVIALHQANGGLGAARNAGAARATGQYCFYLDSDDLLPPDALRRMVTSAEASGSDFVTGVVDRFDSTGRWRSEQYRSPFDVDRSGTHLFAEPLLVYDQMACSKLFRSTFLRDNHLSFPVDVLFEDVAVVMKAHCRASTVDVVSDPTYLWRRRESGSLSITQDRTRPGSVRARFAALYEADRLLEREAPTAVWTEHGVKVLTVDLRIYVRLLADAPESFVSEFYDAAPRVLESLSSGAFERTNVVMRSLAEAVIHGDRVTVDAYAKMLSGSDGRSVRRTAPGIWALARSRPAELIRLAGRAVTGG